MLNPSTLDVIAEAPLSGKEDIDRAVAAARRAFESYGKTTPVGRSMMLLELANAIEEHADELADLESADAGKPRAAFFEDEVEAAADQIRFFAGAARNMEGKAAGEYLEGYTSMIRREPVGVIGQITPWNYPFMMAIWKIGPALATGNTIVLKPAETTPVTTIRLAELVGEIFPPGVFNVVGGHGDPAGSSLVTHPDVDMVSLTGSPGHRQVDRRGRRRHAQARAPGAGRQGTRRGLRRRRHAEGGRDDRRHRLLQRRARTAPPPRACWPGPRCTTTWSRGWPSRLKAW